MDLAYRVRNLGWYWLIKAATGLSDGALDKEFIYINKYVRPRYFFQIRAVGSSPDELRGYRRYRTLYAKVHDGGRYPEANAWFSSGLWEMLASPHWKAADYSAFIASEVSQRSWYRPSSAAFAIGQLAFDSPVFAEGGARAYRAMLLHLGGFPTLENIALLCALYREAHAAFQLAHAENIHGLIVVSLATFSRRSKLPDDLKRCFVRLVEDRMLDNVWKDEDAMPPSGDRRKLTRAKQIKQFIAWYGSRDANQSGANLPILGNSRRMQWLEANHARLLKRFPPIDPKPYLARIHELTDLAERKDAARTAGRFVTDEESEDSLGDLRRTLKIQGEFESAKRARQVRIRDSIKQNGLRQSDDGTLLAANPMSTFTWLDESEKEAPDS